MIHNHLVAQPVFGADNIGYGAGAERLDKRDARALAAADIQAGVRVLVGGCGTPNRVVTRPLIGQAAGVPAWAATNSSICSCRAVPSFG